MPIRFPTNPDTEESTLNKIVKGLTAAKDVFGVAVDLTNIDKYVRDRKEYNQLNDPNSQRALAARAGFNDTLDIFQQSPLGQSAYPTPIGTVSVYAGHARQQINEKDEAGNYKMNVLDMTTAMKPIQDIQDKLTAQQSSLGNIINITQGMDANGPYSKLARQNMSQGLEDSKKSVINKDPAAVARIDAFKAEINKQDESGNFIYNANMLGKIYDSYLKGQKTIAAPIEVSQAKKDVVSAQIGSKEKIADWNNQVRQEIADKSLKARTMIAQAGLSIRTDRLSQQAADLFDKNPLVQQFSTQAYAIQRGLHTLEGQPTNKVANEVLQDFATALNQGKSSSNYKLKAIEVPTLEGIIADWTGIVTSDPNQPAPPKVVTYLKNQGTRLLGAYKDELQSQADVLMRGRHYQTPQAQKVLEDKNKSYTTSPEIQKQIEKFSPAPTSTPMVDVISPQGIPGSIPASKLPEALKRGFKKR